MRIPIRVLAIVGLGFLAFAGSFLPREVGDAAADSALNNCSVGNSALDNEEASLLSMINDWRATNGLVALTTSSNLMRAAAWMASDLGTKRYFDHTDSTGRRPSDRAKDCGYPSDAGENIAGGTLWSGAQDIFTAWKNSPGHNENLLNAPYRKVGIARVNVPGSPYTWYWVADFGFTDDGTTADLPFTGPEYGVRGSDVTPGTWNVVTVLAAGVRVSDLVGWTAWAQLPNGWWQEYLPSDYVAGNTSIGLLPRGMSMDKGRSPR